MKPSALLLQCYLYLLYHCVLCFIIILLGAKITKILQKHFSSRNIIRIFVG
jgi:hypothetical protein